MDFSQFSANAIVGYMPDIALSVPFVGEYQLAPLLAAITIFAVLTALFALIRTIVLARLKVFSARTSTDVDDAIIDAVRGIRPWAYSVVALYISLQFFALPQWFDLTARGIFFFTVVWQAIEIALSFVRYGVGRILAHDMDGDGQMDPNAATASDMVILIARIVLWALGGLFVLSNLGIEVTSLIAGLGIGGVAIAFALQGILSDLFASFSIYFDKPFRIGDFIVVGNDSGTVERIGIKSTRLRTLQGEELVISNTELTTARVQNFKKMKERRVQFNLGVTYDTPYEKIAKIPELLNKVIDPVENIRFERAHFTTYADSALVFEVVYFVLTDDYAKYMDHQQEINLSIMNVFAEEGIEFAYPTQTVYVKQ